MKEIRIFNIKVNPLLKKEFIQIIDSHLKEGKQIIQNGVNAASVNELTTNNQLLESYNNSSLVNIDGMSMVWALRFLGHSVPERVACPDLAIDILKLAEKRNFSIFLLGADETTLSLSVNNIRKSFPKLNISGYRNGYFQSKDEYLVIKMINKANPDILFLGMPSPKKELFVEKYKNQLQVKYFLGVGGFFDILAGKIKRAPLWMQKGGMEWIYRFAQEPKRMWYRYMIGNIKFIKLVIKEKYKSRITAKNDLKTIS
jgi:N-acetylglucosaminyldiphosphoundecaprenol N-acetyl-beta-D-mannosaminyltransferase